MSRRRDKTARQIIVISDTHCNSTLGLCPPSGHKLDDGGRYTPSKRQKDVWSIWDEFWSVWVPRVTRGEPWDLVVNGDAIDGDHHKTPTIITPNMNDQFRVARTVLEEPVRLCRASGGVYEHVRGTEAHVGPSGQEEERLAEALGARPNSAGSFSRWGMFKVIGDHGGHLCHFSHHIGVSSSLAYESSALAREMDAMFSDAGRFKRRPVQVIVRSHRHRHYENRIVGDGGYFLVIVTPGWQLATPYTWRLMTGRTGEPQFGGILVRVGDEELYTRAFVISLARELDD